MTRFNFSRVDFQERGLDHPGSPLRAQPRLTRQAAVSLSPAAAMQSETSLRAWFWPEGAIAIELPQPRWAAPTYAPKELSLSRADQPAIAQLQKGFFHLWVKMREQKHVSGAFLAPACLPPVVDQSGPPLLKRAGQFKWPIHVWTENGIKPSVVVRDAQPWGLCVWHHWK